MVGPVKKSGPATPSAPARLTDAEVVARATKLNAFIYQQLDAHPGSRDINIDATKVMTDVFGPKLTRKDATDAYAFTAPSGLVHVRTKRDMSDAKTADGQSFHGLGAFDVPNGRIFFYNGLGADPTNGDVYFFDANQSEVYGPMPNLPDDARLTGKLSDAQRDAMLAIVGKR